MNRILKEPLLHFLVLGALLFLAYRHRAHAAGRGDAGSIVVTQGQIEHLASGFARIWQRPPTDLELAGLVRDCVREEVLCREAITLGLDKDDAIIRRRLRQKMEFVTDDIAALADPTEADLNTYLQAHPDSFRVEQRFTFRQVYLDSGKHGNELERDAAQLLATLTAAGDQADTSALGDSFLLEHSFEALARRDIASQFGDAFAARLSELPTDRWCGPVESGYGMHFVLVTERTDGRLPELAEVRDLVRRDWENTRRLEANEELYQELLNGYNVTIEGLDENMVVASK